MADQKMMLTEDQLLERAGTAAVRMRTTVEGKPLDAVTQSSAATLLGLADLLSGLSADVHQRRVENDRLRIALARIADMQIRGGRELLERGNWKKMASEFQAIAHEALGRAE